MFADQALMVHPDDKRYQSLIGKKVFIPGTNTLIPVIADSYVDPEFGSGIVKVTPAHDPNDFEVAKRHGLDMPLCMNDDGTMNEMAGKYVGQDRFLCRKNVTTDLEQLGLVHKIESYVHSVGYSERTKVMVEPRLSLQWFVRMQDLAQQTLNDHEVNFVPERFIKTFENWMTNIQDWTISRQLWWGHRIPAWYYNDEVKVQIEKPGPEWKQDEDVLDTWFSSALWPFSTLGWPNEEHPDFKRYYPTDVLVTGYDIIFFWVARMMFQGLEFTHEDPFKHVLIHGLIRDKEGKKMSKSSGNGVDPMDVIDTYGIDALRYFLTTNSAPGADTRYDTEKVESAWNFINKLWNITRFITLNITDSSLTIDESKLTLFDKYILTRLSEVITEADHFYERFEFGEASRILYNFIWDEFASWYLELSKVSLADPKLNENTQAVLLYVLKDVLKLMHPYIPFVTEKLFLEIYNELSIMVSSWPVVNYKFDESIVLAHEIFDTITKVRNLRNEYNVAPSKPLEISLIVTDESLMDVLKAYEPYLVKFLNTKQLTIANEHLSKTAVLLTGTNININVEKSDLIDLEAEKQSLLKQKSNLEKEIERSESLLNNPNFLVKAPKEKKRVEQAKFDDYKKQYEDILEKLKAHV